MKYNQNQRILQVTEKTLIVDVDFAKHKHVARAQDFRGIEFGKALTFQNTRNGLNGLVYWIRTLMAEQQKTQVILGVEPTGQYWMPMAGFLRRYGIKLVLVNPLHVKKSKELDDNSPTKNDVKDARVIAQLVKDGRYSEPHIPVEIYAELWVGMNMRERLVEDLRRVQGRIHNWLDRFSPEFLTVFKDWEGKTALLTLQLFPLPQEIVAKDVVGIVEGWKQGVKRAVGEKRAVNIRAKPGSAKRGRARLRALLFKCIMPLVAKNKEFRELHWYYTTREKNPLKKKQSLIVLCCKLIRVLFVIGTKQITYDGSKLAIPQNGSLVRKAA